MEQHRPATPMVGIHPHGGRTTAYPHTPMRSVAETGDEARWKTRVQERCIVSSSFTPTGVGQLRMGQPLQIHKHTVIQASRPLRFIIQEGPCTALMVHKCGSHCLMRQKWYVIRSRCASQNKTNTSKVLKPIVLWAAFPHACAGFHATRIDGVDGQRGNSPFVKGGQHPAMQTGE